MGWMLHFYISKKISWFYPQQVAFLSLSLEYKDPSLVEIISNKLGIFIKHDLVLFSQLDLVLSVCILMQKRQPFPIEISFFSNFETWVQQILYLEATTIDRNANSLGHFSYQCQDSLPVSHQIYQIFYLIKSSLHFLAIVQLQYHTLYSWFLIINVLFVMLVYWKSWMFPSPGLIWRRDLGCKQHQLFRRLFLYFNLYYLHYFHYSFLVWMVGMFFLALFSFPMLIV